MKEMLYEAQEQAPSPEGKTSIEYSIILKVYKDVLDLIVRHKKYINFKSHDLHHSKDFFHHP